MNDNKSFYKLAGIENQAEFYGRLYASAELLHPDYFQTLERFHIRWARTMWVFDNIASGSTVLDIGCGSGLLALLKRKDVRLVGIDLSPECAAAARRNGYDMTCVGNLTHLPFFDQSFDYVVSLDVMGHIEFKDKDAVIDEIHRVLKPDGITMHGIEIMNTDRRKDYDQMSEAELKTFIAIDGHVGMESEDVTRKRFANFFSDVKAEPRFSICQSAEELIKQSDEYGVPLCDEDLLAYLRHMSHNERRAFNMAMGYIFQQISNFAIHMPPSEYLFLKAANVPLGAFYNEHAERNALTPNRRDEGNDLNQSTTATFDGGWYPAEDFPPIGRWMGRRASIRFSANRSAKLRFTIVTHIPDVDSRPLRVEMFLNGFRQKTLVIPHNEKQEVELSLSTVCQNSVADDFADHELELKADRTWQPRPNTMGPRDDREISVAVFDVKIVK